MQRQNQSWDDLSIFHKVEIMQGLASFPAMTAMLFLRRGLGYRFLSPGSILGTSVFMFVIAEFARESPYHDALQLFSAIVFIGGMMERAARLKEFKQGFQQHTHFIGESRLAFRWLPNFLKRNRRVERLIDPLAWIALGVGAYQFSPALGGWMVFSGMCLRVFEAAVHRKEQERDMDALDGLIESEIHSERIDRLSNPASTTAEVTTDSQGIPTGLAQDIQKQVEARQAKRNAHPPRL